MSFVVMITSTKPEEAKWFFSVDPESVGRLETWMASQPGITSFDKTSVDKNTVVRIIEFFSKEHADNLMENIKKHPDYLLKEEYNELNSIKTTIDILQA